MESNKMEHPYACLSWPAPSAQCHFIDSRTQGDGDEQTGEMFYTRVVSSTQRSQGLALRMIGMVISLSSRAETVPIRSGAVSKAANAKFVDGAR